MTSGRRGVALRHLSFAIAVGVTLVAILVWAARPQWHSDLLAAHRLGLPAAQFRVVAGAGEESADGVLVTAAGPRDVALQTMLPGAGFEAADFRVLRYAFTNFPRTLELSFLFRRADRPDDVQTVSLPWPGKGVASFDLTDLPEWHGHIVEVGFAEYPTPQSIPPGGVFAPFVLHDAELWSTSWRGAFAVLATEWSGYWPWSQRSVHALGRDATRPGGTSLLLVAALGASGIVLWAIVLLGLRGRRLGAFVLVCVAVAWLVLDLSWQTSLQWRLGAARDVYADKTWAERTLTVVDEPLRGVATQIEQRLAGAREGAHVLVAADSAYTLLRLLWHLQPLNAAVYNQVVSGTQMPAPGTYVVLYDAPSLRGSAQFARLVARSRVVAAPGDPGIRANLASNPLVLEYTGKLERHRMHGSVP